MAGTESVKQRTPAALSSAIAFVVGFVPWIVYWILVGNARSWPRYSLDWLWLW
jgi:hypothetical protein